MAAVFKSGVYMFAGGESATICDIVHIHKECLGGSILKAEVDRVMEVSVAGEIDRIDAIEVVEKEVVDSTVDFVGKLGISYAFDIPHRLIRRLHDVERVAQNLPGVAIVRLADVVDVDIGKFYRLR